MRVRYLLMQFPVPSETFSSTDIQALRSQGVVVAISTLLPRHPDYSDLVKKRGLEDFAIDSVGPRSFAQGFLYGLIKPNLLARGLLYCIMGSSKPQQIFRLLALLPRSLAIVQNIEKDTPDVVHLFWGHYPSLVGLLLKDLPEPPTVTQFLGAYDLELKMPISKRLLKRADWVFTHAQANLPDLVAMGAPTEKMTVVRRGMKVAGRRSPDHSRRVPQRIVSIGRLIPEKAMEDVLMVFRSVATTYPDASLRILGSGPERDRLEKLADDMGFSGQVSFLGHVDHNRVFQELCEASVFLFMSRKSSERLPNVVKEAIFCESAVVTTDSLGMNELIPNSNCGVIVPVGDIAGAAEAVCTLLGNSDRAATAAKSAKNHLLTHFDVDTNMNTYLQVWNDLLSEVAEEAASPATDAMRLGRRLR